MKLEFSRQIFEKKLKHQVSIKIRLVGAELFHAVGQTDVMKLIVAFLNISSATKKSASYTSSHFIFK